MAANVSGQDSLNHGSAQSADCIRRQRIQQARIFKQVKRQAAVVVLQNASVVVDAGNECAIGDVPRVVGTVMIKIVPKCLRVVRSSGSGEGPHFAAPGMRAASSSARRSSGANQPVSLGDSSSSLHAVCVTWWGWLGVRAWGRPWGCCEATVG